MATRPQVSIRLATDGKTQVVRDFGDIGDAGDASAKRVSSAFTRAANDADAALAKLQKASERMAAIAPTSAVQSTINQSTGVDSAAALNNARSSAAAIQAQMTASEQAAQRLLSSVDPLFAAQMRYNQSLEQAIELQKLGILSDEQFAQVQAGLKKQLDDSVVGFGNLRSASGTARIAQMELMGASRGITDALASGMPIQRALAMEMGRLTEAAAFMGGGLGKVGEFLSGPWGIAIMVGMTALVPLLSKLALTKDEVGKVTDELDKQAQKTIATAEAQKSFGLTLDGVTEAVVKNREALKQLTDQEQSAAERALTQALAEVQKAARIRESTLAILEQEKANLQNAQAVQFGAGGGASAYGAQQFFQQQIDQSNAALATAKQDLADANEQVREATAHVYADAISKEPVELIKNRYKDLINQATKRAIQESNAAAAAGDQAKAQALITVELQKQVAALAQKRDAEVKAYEDSHRKGPANPGGTAIFNDQIAAFADIANKYRGDSETRDRGVLQAFFREANINLDPEKTAWCAAFVNAVLAAGGVHGTGSLAASSFLTFGKDDTRSPQKGDIVVIRSNGSPSGMHVGVLDSIDKNGNITLTAGNTGNKVAEETVGPKQVLAVRRPPTPSEQAAFDEKQAGKAEQAQQTFTAESDKLYQQYLEALGKTVQGYEEQAAVQLVRARGEHDAEAKEIASKLAEGKYGDATSQLAIARAAQLQAANDQVLKERQAAVAFESELKSLQSQDALNEETTKFRTDGLQYAESIAKSSKERRDLALQIVDIEYQEKLTHLQYLKALAELAGKTDEAAKIQQEINQLPSEKARATDQANRSTRSPFEDYFAGLPQNMAEVRDSIEKDGVDALNQFNDGLVNVLTNSKNLHDAWANLKTLFHDVAASILADMLKLAEEEAVMAIFKAVVGAVGGGSGGNVVDLTGSQYASQLGHFASGTQSAPGGMAWVGENGPELAYLPRGTKITPAAQSRRIAAANENGPMIGNLVVNADFRGAAPEAVAGIRADLEQLKRDLPAQIVGTWVDARQRFAIR
jgi:uncharacterized protein (TIGR02594 family)